MGSEPIWPARGGRYDPYDPRHPMWTDPFWSTYCANPLRAADPAAPGWSSAPGGFSRAPAGPPPGRRG
jgi:hypothetical protein